MTGSDLIGKRRQPLRISLTAPAAPPAARRPLKMGLARRISPTRRTNYVFRGKQVDVIGSSDSKRSEDAPAGLADIRLRVRIGAGCLQRPPPVDDLRHFVTCRSASLVSDRPY